MPRLSAWFVRIAFIYLLIGFTLGSVLLANEGLAFDPRLGQYLPAHVEILMVGWVMQLALGVAYWILPRFTSGLPRGRVLIAWASLIIINVGVLLIVGSVTLKTPWLALPGRICEVAGILSFVSVLWRRARPSS